MVTYYFKTSILICNFILLYLVFKDYLMFPKCLKSTLILLLKAIRSIKIPLYNATAQYGSCLLINTLLQVCHSFRLNQQPQNIIEYLSRL